jgi:hypothetical protein
LLIQSLPVSLDCPFLIADSVFASFSGLSIFDCCLCLFLLIVHFCFLKNGQSRETGKDRISNQKWTIQRNWQRPNQQSKMDNPEKLTKTESAIKNGQSRETGNIDC